MASSRRGDPAGATPGVQHAPVQANMRTGGGMGGQRMNWFQQIRPVLQARYVAGQPEDVVGFLRGNGSPMQWRGMTTAGPPHNQMLILGNQEPTRE